MLAHFGALAFALRSRPLLTSHFSILAKVSLSAAALWMLAQSLSKGDFCGSRLENPLEIILRQAQDDFSLDAKMRSCFWTTPYLRAGAGRQT